MTPLKVAKQSIDLASIVADSGVDLQQRGSRHCGLCPFHSEKTPSFYIFQDQRFKCFGGCGESGDVIDYVQKFYGLSFPDALKHLGIKQCEASSEIKHKIEQHKLARQTAKRKKKFQEDLQNTLLILISATKKAAKNFKTIENFEKYGDILQPLAYWEYNLELLSSGTDEERHRVCKEFKSMELLPVEGFFKPEFDYFAWLRKLNKKRDADEWEINLHFAGRETSCAEALASG